MFDILDYLVTFALMTALHNSLGYVIGVLSVTEEPPRMVFPLSSYTIPMIL